jgi:hypothetical protein
MATLGNHRRRAALLLRAAGDRHAVRHLLGARAWRLWRDSGEGLQRRLNFTGEHRFTDRATGAGTLLLLVAGHKPYLWPHTLPRVARAVPADVDVCVVAPGVRSPELESLAGRHGWSVLSTTENAVALAMNLAVARHPAARWLHKLDEDVFVAEGHFERLRAGYDRVAADGRYAPGFVAPVLNVNGYGYRLFLEELGLEQDYLERFGELRQAADGIRAHHDGEAARWLWERSLPFDEVAARFAARPFAYSAVPHRFSIGAILLERAFWEEIGGFYVVPRAGMGRDEEHLCKECLERSRPALVIHDVLAGHYSFGPQDPVMRPALGELESGLAPSAPPVRG